MASKHLRPSLKLLLGTVGLWLCLITLGATKARADKPEATAALSSSETTVGQPVELQIKVSGTTGAQPPGSIDVDGLDIRYSGQSQMIEGHNFSFSYSFVYSYTVVPQRTGTFKIPPQKILAGSDTLRTPALTLNVGGSSQNATGSTAGRAVATNRIGFVELLLAKKDAYVGEVIPAEIRVAVNTRTPLESLGAGPSLTGQGFTTQPMPEPRQTIETIKGNTYHVFTFKTAIAAARPGKIDVGPVEITLGVRIPQTRRNSMGPRDLFDDPFFDNFFNDPAFAPSVPREVTFKSDPATIEVKALPPHAPADFSGAIGSFSLETEAKPKKVQVGDPITVTARITGRGNFDRVTAPAPANTGGWHQYPPTSNFKKDDDIGISGTKTFETVLTPNEKKNAVPAFGFSYFDPVREKYVALQSEAIPVQVEGEAAPAASPPPTAASASSVRQAPAPKPAPKTEDILYQITDWPGVTQSFTPLYRRPNFWLAQLLPLLVLLSFIGWHWRRRRRSDRVALRRAEWQHQIAEVERRLRRSELSPSEYYAEAARAVQLKTALARGINPNVVDAGTAASAFRMKEPERAQLHDLFQKRDEMRYSGGSNGNGTLSAEQQRDVLQLIDSLRP